MSPAKRAFFLVFAIFVGIGFLIWIVKLIAPDAASITWNNREVGGLGALAITVGLGAFFGLILGLFVAGIVKLVTRSPAKG